MADLDIATPGYSIDITSAEFRFDGDKISAAVESMTRNTKTDEELTHLQGLQDPQERTAGQRTHDGDMTWATRQWLLFCALVGGADGENAVLNKVFGSLTVITSPLNNDKVYQFTYKQFRMHSVSDNLDKSAGKTKVTCSWLSQEKKVVSI